jgi:hypothetical protein
MKAELMEAGYEDGISKKSNVIPLTGHGDL